MKKIRITNEHELTLIKNKKIKNVLKKRRKGACLIVI